MQFSEFVREHDITNWAVVARSKKGNLIYRAISVHHYSPGESFGISEQWHYFAIVQPKTGVVLQCGNNGYRKESGMRAYTSIRLLEFP